MAVPPYDVKPSPGRAVRWVLGGLLVAWAFWVAREFQDQHPLPWRAWATNLERLDWSQLAPDPGRTLLALRHLLATLIIVLAAACTGARALVHLWPQAPAPTAGADFAEHTTRGERFWLCVACGLAVLAVVLVGLATVGGLYGQVLWGLVGAAIALGAPALWRLLRVAPPPATPDRFGGVRGIAIAAIVIGILATLPRALSPHVLFDAHVYHLALPRAYLAAGGFVRFPNLVFANAPHAMALLYAIPLSFGGEQVAKLLHGACGIGFLVLTAGLGRRLVGRTAGVLAALLTFATPLVIEHWSTSYTELAMGFAFMAAVWCTWYGLFENERGAFRVAALTLGLYAGIKYTALSGVVGLGVAVAAVLMRRRAPAREWWRTLLPFAVGLAVGAGPWLIKNAIHVGNPVYPMATGLFGLGPRFPSEVARTAEVVALHGMGRAPLDMLLLPWRITVFGDHGSPTFDGAILPVWLMVAPLLLVRRRGTRGIPFLGALALGYFIAWIPVVHITRYLIPIFPAFSILAVDALWRLFPAVSEGGRRARVLVWVGFGVAAVWWLPPIASRAVWGPITFGPAAWGQVSAHEFLLREEQTTGMYAWMDAHLPADAAVLGLWENRRYRCPRRLEADGVFWASRWVDRFAAADDLGAFGADLRARGLTHVLFNARLQPAFMPLSPTPEDEAVVQRGLARIDTFLATHCEWLHEDNDLRLYRIRAPGLPDHPA